MKKLGEILKKKNLVTEKEIKEALNKQHKTGERFGSVLVNTGLIKKEDLLTALSEQLDMPYVKLNQTAIDPSACKRLPAKFAWHYGIMPLEFKDNVLVVATSDPLVPLDDIKSYLGCAIKEVLALDTEIAEYIRKYYGVGAETIERIIDTTPKKPVDRYRVNPERSEEHTSELQSH